MNVIDLQNAIVTYAVCLPLFGAFVAAVLEAAMLLRRRTMRRWGKV